jgi:dihydropteroate synthase
MNHDSTIAALLARPIIMGIVNVTPNSFSDGGQFSTTQGTIDINAAATYAANLVQQGAAILDIGGEASSFFRPGVVPISPEEQIRRVVPVIAAIAARRLTIPGTTTPALISVDTRSALVARAAVEAGAHIINDISAGQFDPRMFQTAAQLATPIILMHMRDESTAKPQPYQDVTGTVQNFLQDRKGAALATGVAPHRIWLDPGIGFGKTPADNWKLIANLDSLVAAGHPVVVGASRKRFLTFTDTSRWPAPLPSPSRHTGPDWHERDTASAVVTALAASKGVLIHRVHNVAANRTALEIAARTARTKTEP